MKRAEITVRDKRGNKFSGTPEEVVASLHAGSFIAEQELADADYMRVVAERLDLWNGTEISVRNALAFLRDLAAASIIIIVDNNDQPGEEHVKHLDE